MQTKKGKKEVCLRVTIMVIIRKDLLSDENEYLVVKEDNTIARNHTTRIHFLLNTTFIYIYVFFMIIINCLLEQIHYGINQKRSIK